MYLKILLLICIYFNLEGEHNNFNVNFIINFIGYTHPIKNYEKLLYQKYLGNNKIIFIFRLKKNKILFQKIENFTENSEYKVIYQNILEEDDENLIFHLIDENWIFSYNTSNLKFYFIKLLENKIDWKEFEIKNEYLKINLKRYTTKNHNIINNIETIYILFMLYNNWYYIKINYKINNKNKEIELKNNIDLFSIDFQSFWKIENYQISGKYIIFESEKNFYIYYVKQLIKYIDSNNTYNIKYNSKISKKIHKYIRFYETDLDINFYGVKVLNKNYIQFDFFSYKFGTYFSKFKINFKDKEKNISKYYFNYDNGRLLFFYWDYKKKVAVIKNFLQNNFYERYKLPLNFFKLNNLFFYAKSYKIFFFFLNFSGIMGLYYNLKAYRKCNINNIFSQELKNKNNNDETKVIVNYLGKDYKFTINNDIKKINEIKYYSIENVELLNKSTLLIENEKLITFYKINYLFKKTEKLIDLKCKFYFKFYDFSDNFIFICFLQKKGLWWVKKFANNLIINNKIKFVFKKFLLNYKIYEYEKNIYLWYNEKSNKIKIINLFEEENNIKFFIIYEKNINLYDYKDKDIRVMYSQKCFSIITKLKIINKCFFCDKNKNIKYSQFEESLNNLLKNKQGYELLIDFKFKINLNNKSFNYILCLKKGNNLYLFHYFPKLESKINLYLINSNKINNIILKRIVKLKIINKSNKIIKNEQIKINYSMSYNKINSLNFSTKDFLCINKVNNKKLNNSNYELDFKKTKEDYYNLKYKNDSINTYWDLSKLIFEKNISKLKINFEYKNESFNNSIKIFKNYFIIMKFDIFDKIKKSIKNILDKSKKNELLTYFEIIKNNKYNYYLLDNKIFIFNLPFIFLLHLENDKFKRFEWINIFDFKSIIKHDKMIINNYNKIKYEIHLINNNFLFKFILDDRFFYYNFNDNNITSYKKISNFEIFKGEFCFVYFNYTNKKHYLLIKMLENNIKENKNTNLSIGDFDNLIIEGKKYIIFKELKMENKKILIIINLMMTENIYFISFNIFYGKFYQRFKYIFKNNLVIPKNLNLFKVEIIGNYIHSYLFEDNNYFVLIKNKITILKKSNELKIEPIKYKFIDLQFLKRNNEVLNLKEIKIKVFKEIIFLYYHEKIYFFNKTIQNSYFLYYYYIIYFKNYSSSNINKLRIKEIQINKIFYEFLFEIITNKNEFIKLKVYRFLKIKFKKKLFYSNYLVFNIKNFFEKFEKDLKIPFINNKYKNIQYINLFLKELFGFVIFLILLFILSSIIVKKSFFSKNKENKKKNKKKVE